MSDYIITTERISWLNSLRMFHQLERDDEEQDRAVNALERQQKDHQLHGEDLIKRLEAAIKAQAPIDQQHEELVYKVDRAKTAMEKERTSRKSVEKLLSQEMKLKDSLIGMQRELLEQRYGFEIEKKLENWERERVRMKSDSVTFIENLIIAEAEIKEMMKHQDAQAVMKKEHYDNMVCLKDALKKDEKKWKGGIEKVACQKSVQKTEVRSKDLLRAEERKAKVVEFRREKAMRSIAWKKERTKMVKNNRVLILKSCFTEHWINDLGDQIRLVGADILEIKKSLALELQDLEEKCLTFLYQQGIDPEPLKQVCRTKLDLDDMVPSGKNKNSIWKIVVGWI